MQVCDKKSLPGERNTAHPFLMETNDDDVEDDIRPIGQSNALTALQALPEDPAAQTRTSLRDWIVYLIQPTDTTDNGLPCLGSHGAYEPWSIAGLTKALLWIGIGIAGILILSHLH